jgi:UDP-2,3-diacylglucosamine hydrolase
MVVWDIASKNGYGIANYLSRRSRTQTGATEETFLGEDKEWLIIYSKDVLAEKKIDFFVFGHRHLAIDYRLSSTEALAKGDSAEASAKEGSTGARYINLGDWIRYFTYASFDGEKIELRSYKGNDDKIIRK